MDKTVFAERLHRAAECTRDFTRTLVIEPLQPLGQTGGYKDEEGQRMPFRVQSPPLPPSYDPESRERFSLNGSRSTPPVKLILRELARRLGAWLKRK